MKEEIKKADPSPALPATAVAPPGRSSSTGAVDSSGEFAGGNRGGRSGTNQGQNRAVGQDDPVAEGSRQGRERYRSSPAESDAERKTIPPV